jgi:AraC family transcriptional regulator
VEAGAVRAAAGDGGEAMIAAARSPAGERTGITWITREPGREPPGPAGAASLRTSAAWTCLRVAELRCRPGAIPEGHSPAHLVVVTLHRPVSAEVSWGGPAQRGEVTVPANGVTILPAGVRCAARWHDPVQAVIVALSPRLVTAELQPQIGCEDPFVAHVVLALRDLAGAGAAADAPAAETLAYVLSAHLLRTASGSRRERAAGGRGALPRSHFDRVAAYVGERLHEPLTLAELAAVAGMSVSRFARTFKASAGVAPHHYVVGRRLERAKALLEETGLPVGDIAVQCGFTHPSHLTSTFRRVFAITPTRYREMAGGGR